MTHHSAMPLGVAPEHVVIAIGIPAAALALVAVGWLLGRRRSRPTRQRDSLAVTVSSIAAAGCTAYSGETSWAFATDYLGMNGVARAALFGVAELGLLALALIARQQLLNEGTPGLPGTLVWVVTGVMVVPAYAESGLVGGSVRAVFGPILAAVLWHFVMGIELRSRKPGAASQSMLATLGREVRERLLSRLGISARDRNAAQITRDRATSRAVELAARLAEYSPQQRQRWRGRRLARQLSKALGRAAVGTDSRQRDELLARLAARRHALTLVTTPLPSPWTSDREDTNAVAPRPEDALALSVRARRSPVPAHSYGDRGPETAGPVHCGGDRATGTEDSPPGTVDGVHKSQSPGSEPASSRGPRSPAAGTRATRSQERAQEALVPDEGRVAGTDTAVTGKPSETAEVGAIRESGPEHVGGKGPRSAESGTEPAQDRGPTTPDTGTEPAQDRGPTTPDTGTEPAQDRGPTTPDTGTEPAQDRGPRQVEMSIEDLVERVRPHVPALLARDRNAAVTRVQVREILRAQELPGVGNKRMGRVLKQLRDAAEESTAGSAAA
ncbi:hypothetical protein [Streptomyces sp. NRRL_B-2249]|uniref:hypothetical protein n=1 Tax=Streptomyces sp. NRRL_B-2249 TaxID=3028697 RepID=UPI0029BA4680|nr:hypothetical protein [Streptomyces sp. NRRL_B-2249]MDX2977426.1 hypothetical protein [Streptomyces sp. NRRL_B-2249]